MTETKTHALAQRLVKEVIELWPGFVVDPLDLAVTGGNGALVVLDAEGGIHGHLFGEDRAKGRFVLGIAMRKALQVQATGIATGCFEKQVYNDLVSEKDYGLARPDLVGWPGGLPLVEVDGSAMAVGFSGLRGVRDVALIEAAVARVPGLEVKTERGDA